MRRFGAFVEPSPIGSVSFPLTFVVLATSGRAKLREAPVNGTSPKERLQYGFSQRFVMKQPLHSFAVSGERIFLASAETSTSAIVFTRRISHTYYLGVFAVAFGTAWACTHGDLLLRNCHSPILLY